MRVSVWSANSLRVLVPEVIGGFQFWIGCMGHWESLAVVVCDGLKVMVSLVLAPYPTVLLTPSVCAMLYECKGQCHLHLMTHILSWGPKH